MVRKTHLHNNAVLNHWEVFSFDLPFISGLRRQGLILRLLDKGGHERWGEIAPYPGRSRETLGQALDQLLTVLNTGKIQEELFPSVQFGIESALAFPPPKGKAPLYAFLNGTPNEILHQADRAFANGHSIVKFKISSLSKAAASDLIRALQNRFRLRVDCNRAFSFADAMSIFSDFDPSAFDYIEDPTYEMDRLPDFSHPFAIDETILDYRGNCKTPCPSKIALLSHFAAPPPSPTLSSMSLAAEFGSLRESGKLTQNHRFFWDKEFCNSLDPLKKHRNLYGFILKPTILGGIKGCAPFIEFAQKNQLQVVLSPAFETGLGLLQIFSLAHHFQLLAQPIGLDTHRYLAQDLLFPGVDFNSPLFSLSHSPKINIDLLKEIAHGTCKLPHL